MRDAGMLTIAEVARKLRVSRSTVKSWRRVGLLRAERYNDKGECLYAPIEGALPRKRQGSKLARRMSAGADCCASREGGAV